MKQIAKLHQILILLSAFVFSFTGAAAQSSALGNATTRTYSDGLLDLRGPVNLSLDDTNTTKTKFTTYFANRIARENGRLWIWKAGKFVLLDSVSGGGSSIDTTSLSNRIDARVKYTDTAAMLAAYLRKADTTPLSNRIDARVKYTDTAAMLAPYLRKDDTVSLSNRINAKQDSLTLTTTGTSGAATLIGSTLNIPNYATGSGTVTSIATTNGTGITGGTITTSGTLAIDTTLVATRAWRKKGDDSLGAIIATKLNITDTASMLASYLREADTASLSNRINTKLNITDTANMRVRLAAGSNITLTGTYPNITIAASGGGGGGADTQAYHYTGDSYSGNLRLGSSGSGTRRLAMYLNSDTLLRLGVTSGGFRWGIFNSNSSTANNYEAVVIGGENNEASGIRSVVIGGIGGKAQGTNSIGMNGGKAEVSGSIAIGTLETYANGVNSTSIGSYTSNGGYSGCINLSGYGEASFNVNTANNQLAARFTGGYIFRTSSGSDIVTIKPSGVINLKISFVYPDNAAAIAGGLVAGDMYRTSTGDLKIVY